MVDARLIEAACRAPTNPLLPLCVIRIWALPWPRPDSTLYHQAARMAAEQPLQSIIARHTVGLADPLTPADIPADEAVADQTPSAHRLHHHLRAAPFQNQNQRPTDTDLTRWKRSPRYYPTCPRISPLRWMARAVQDHHRFQTFWAAIQDHDALRPFFERLLFIEQPLHRDVALGHVVRSISGWPDRAALSSMNRTPPSTASTPPCALATPAPVTRIAKAFQGLINRCLIDNAERRETTIMSGEDLCNVGPVALLQDLAVCAALGIEAWNATAIIITPDCPNCPCRPLAPGSIIPPDGWPLDWSIWIIHQPSPLVWFTPTLPTSRPPMEHRSALERLSVVDAPAPWASALWPGRL